MIEALGEKAKLAEVIAKLNEVIVAMNEMPTKVEDRRGPKSQREMTDDDARNIMSGELKSASHKDAAEKLNLSYAQVYSCRKGFTFKHIHKELKDALVAAEKAKQEEQQ